MLVEILARLAALGEVLARLVMTAGLERLAGVLASVSAGQEMLAEGVRPALRVGCRDRSINWSTRRPSLSLR